MIRVSIAIAAVTAMFVLASMATGKSGIASVLIIAVACVAIAVLRLIG